MSEKEFRVVKGDEAPPHGALKAWGFRECPEGSGVYRCPIVKEDGNMLAGSWADFPCGCVFALSFEDVYELDVTGWVCPKCNGAGDVK